MQQSPTHSRLDPLVRKSGNDRLAFSRLKNVSGEDLTGLALTGAYDVVIFASLDLRRQCSAIAGLNSVWTAPS